jgi:arylsulfatase A-like enzyme
MSRSRRSPSALGPLGALCLAVLVACSRPPALPRLERFPASQGAASPVKLGKITRPAVRLPPDGTLRWPVTLTPESRLVFAVGATDRAEEVTALDVDVAAGGRSLYRRRLPVNRDHWFPCTVSASGSGPTEVVIRVWPVVAEGSPARGSETARIAIAVPRLYRGADRPSRTLLWISQDAVRADHLGTYGYARPTSPFFHRISRDYVLFERAMSTSSWTLQSMASQFTSLPPSEHGAKTTSRLRPDSPTVFEALADAGFTVLGVAGNHFLSAEYGVTRGLDVMAFDPGTAGELNELLLRLLAVEAGGEDVALFIHYMDPHATYAPPRPYDFAFRTAYQGPVGTTYRALEQLQDPKRLERVVALYDGEILYTDAMIARLFEALSNRRRLEGAVVAYTADHGEEFGDHGGCWHGRTLYEEVLHVPFALKIPGLAARRVAAPVSMIDLAPTLLDAFDIPPPRAFRGRSLLPFLRGRPVPPIATLVAETNFTTDGRQLVAVREHDRKVIVHLPAGQEIDPPVLRTELFDLGRDPKERVDQSRSPEAEPLRRHALAFVRRVRAEADPGRPAVLDPDTREALEALGYFGR